MNNDRPTTGAHAAATIGTMATPSSSSAANSSPAWDATRVPVLESEIADVVFEVLVSVMWSDGELASGDVERGRAAADLMCVRSKRGGALGAIANGPLPFPTVPFEQLDAYGRRLAYAGACWIDTASEHPSERRTSFIRAVRMKLDLEDSAVSELRAVAEVVHTRYPVPRDGMAALMRNV